MTQGERDHSVTFAGQHADPLLATPDMAPYYPRRSGVPNVK
jgi:hypothetical protein